MSDLTRTGRHDVLVLGGGPAGSAAAIRLAGLGLDVGLVEPAPFPRPHVGICIAEETANLFDLLGVGEGFRALGPLPRELTAVRWGRSHARLVQQRGYHVDRGALDQLLIQRAADEGATIYQPARTILAPDKHDGGYDCTISGPASSQRVSCAFLVDAAGRRAALPGAKAKDGLPLIALYADWRLHSRPPFDGLMESGTDAWAWFAQTRQDRATVSVFLDPRTIRLKKGDLRTRYQDLLADFAVLSETLEGSLCSEPRACDATSSHSIDVVGAHHIRVGDAAMTVDPLSSQGVHLALQSGIQAAIVINTTLRRPPDAHLARQFYRDKLSERVARFSAGARTEYARVAAISRHSFWQERADRTRTTRVGMPNLRADPLPRDPDLHLSLATEAIISCGPIIAGNFVERGRTIAHPNLLQPVAFVAGANLPTLLQHLPFRLVELPTLWGQQVGETRAWEIAKWLWQRRILVEAPQPSSGRSPSARAMDQVTVASGCTEPHGSPATRYLCVT